MKKYLTLIALSLSFLSNSQGGWTQITSTNNPITTFTVNGVYNGAAWVDINNDGNTDLFASPGFLFLNNGNGSFSTLGGSTINPTPQQAAGGCSWADINNDGNIDFITSQDPTEMYLNNGNSTFQNISTLIPGLTNYASWGCALADINNDNRLDLLFAHANGFHPQSTAQPCKLFIQNPSSFSFTQKTGYYFTDSLRPYTVPYFDDYDQDGDMDIFIASGPGGTAGPDYYYKNMKLETGMDTLYKMTAEPWANELQDGQCYNFVDYDNDEDLDMCLTNYSGANDRFYINNGNGNYTSVGTPFTTLAPHLANCWGDYDNDGDMDVIIASDYTYVKYNNNNGDGTFTQLSLTLNATIKTSCIVNCDYDNDGDLDIFIHGNNTGKSLWRNDTVAANRNWVNYTLKGTVSNASAIGAFIKVKAFIHGAPVWQTRHVTAQNSFQGQNDLRVHFGLNDATVIDSVMIHWPSGLEEFYLNKTINQFETLVEGNGIRVGLKEQNDSEYAKIYPNPAKSTVTIVISKTIARTKLKVTDTRGKTIYQNILIKDKMELPTSEFSPGVYIFILDLDGKILKKKVVLEK